MKMHRLIPSTLLIASLTLLAAGCVKVNPTTPVKGPSTLSDVTMASSVSSEGQPLSIATVFLASTPTIYVSARISEAPVNTEVGAKWVLLSDEAGKPLNQTLFEDTTIVTGSKYISFSHSAPSRTWTNGQYSVIMSLDGKDLTSAQFSVSPVQKADVPAPTISSFTATPDAISTGQAVTLNWATRDATSVDISTLGTVSPSGNRIVVPVNSTEYILTAKNAAGSTSARVMVKVTSFASDKPELVITGFRVEGDKAYYTIKNIAVVTPAQSGGVLNAKRSTTYLYVQGDHKASSLVDTLAPGEERTLFFPNYQWPYGGNRSYTLPIRVCADALDEVGEYDENNNCLQVDW